MIPVTNCLPNKGNLYPIQTHFMKVRNKLVNGCKKSILFVVISLLPFYLTVYGQTIKNFSSKNQEVSLSGNHRLTLAANRNPLHLNYPAEVERVYRQAGKKLLWIAPDTVKMHAADAMMLLDCVLQYGLNHDDYHPRELLYDKLNLYTSGFSKTSFAEKLRFDRLLTDAMLTFMNALHYGKLNPEYRPARIDKGVSGFSANIELLKALENGDFNSSVTSVQPQSEAYINLQYRMHLLEGRMTAECYSFPDSEIRKMAVNMERLRWIDKNEHTFIQINIPSLTLKFITPDSTYEFKVIVGAPSSPTPVRQDALSYFNTQPDGLAARLNFKSDGHPATGIRGITGQKAFSKRNRAVSAGYIAVEQPEKLAALLLKYDGANNEITLLHQALVNGKTQRFNLKKPVPLIITYQTLEINEGLISSYKDLYNRDNDLETALYNRELPLTLKYKSGL
jgi:murein L,D-transpeptidase YcbB/YkuD